MLSLLSLNLFSSLLLNQTLTKYFLVIATRVNQNVKNTDVQNICSCSVCKDGKNVLFATNNKNILSGKFIINAIAVSPTDSFNDCLSILTLHQIQYELVAWKFALLYILFDLLLKKMLSAYFHNSL